MNGIALRNMKHLVELLQDTPVADQKPAHSASVSVSSSSSAVPTVALDNGKVESGEKTGKVEEKSSSMYVRLELEPYEVVILERAEAIKANAEVMKQNSISSDCSSDLKPTTPTTTSTATTSAPAPVMVPTPPVKSDSTTVKYDVIAI